MCRHSMPNNDRLTVYVDGFHVEEIVVSDLTAIVRRHEPVDQHRHILHVTECDIPGEVCLLCKGAREQNCYALTRHGVIVKPCLHERLLAYLSPDTVTGDDGRQQPDTRNDID